MPNSTKILSCILLLLCTTVVANETDTWSKLPVDDYYSFCMSSPLTLFKHQLDQCTDKQGNVDHDCAKKAEERLLKDSKATPEECAMPRKKLLPVVPDVV